jgi:hypothetical protein
MSDRVDVIEVKRVSSYIGQFVGDLLPRLSSALACGSPCPDQRIRVLIEHRHPQPVPCT